MSLEIKGLTKRFDSNTLFENFSYKFYDTGIYAIAGPSGRGKTTLLRMICALDEDYLGEIIGGGLENCSFAFQEYRLFPQISALMNVAVANGGNADEYTLKHAKKMLLRLGFTEDEMELLPSELSGGMKQRVALARAFMKTSSILLLDEPTKELDPALRNTLREIIKEEAKSRLIIFVSHNDDDISSLNAYKICL
jgi:ABC-type multidrug transport system ATPase subunit